MISLFPISAIYGVVAVLVFRRLTERAAIRRSVNRILAHVMELGLFLDSPGLVFGAQLDLLRENLRLLRLVIVPGVLVAVLFVPMYAIYRHGPLPVGEPSVVTLQMKYAAMPAVQLEAPEGIVVETPGVRIVRDRQISWRVRPLRESSGDLRFHVENRVVLASFFLHDSAIQSIEIRYPTATILGWSWLVWFGAISSISAIAFGLLR
jgi:hypothetical protein